MQELVKKRAFGIGWRTRVPAVARIAALVLFASGILVVGLSYYKLRNNKGVIAKPGAPELSKEVTGYVENYEQRVTKNNRLYLLVKASRDTTFSDGHHELDNVSLAIYPPEGDIPDQITANKAISTPENSKISFAGNVKIATKDKLKVNTESLSFDQDSGFANTEDLVSFERENVTGRSIGVVLQQKIKKLDFKKDVEITVTPQAEPNSTKKTLSKPVTIKAASGSFENETLKFTFAGGATVEQDRDIMSGDTLYAGLNTAKRLEKVELRGNAYLRAMEPGNAAEVHSKDMDFFLDENQRLQRAVAQVDVIARSLDADSDMQLSGSNALELTFQTNDTQSLLKQMYAGGRTVVTLSAPKSKPNDPAAASKRLTADSLKLTWRTTGKDLERAEANGNAELFVDPIVKNPTAERKTLTADQFDCSFFDAGNLMKSCIANNNSKVVMEPLEPSQKRGTRTITAKTMTTSFVRETQDVERVEANGDAKFNENDRNGLAANMTYIASEGMVRLRGGEPTIWDSRGRTKAVELDSDLASRVSYGRGKVSTTYYSQEQTNGATPFAKVKSPVYIMSDRVEFRHDSGLATYSGNGRAWQDDNFVKGDKLVLYMNEKRMESSGHVQTAIYNIKRQVDGVQTVVPVFATSDSMFYSDADRVIHYQGNVDIKQSPDRLTGGLADVYLSKETNEMQRTVAQQNVVLTQPARKGVGDWVEYTAANEIAVLKGNPARVQDAEKGDTEGSRLTLSVRDSKVTADDARGPLTPGRVRSTHKINKKP
jgi:LPS export ABC transporter protein LptC